MKTPFQFFGAAMICLALTACGMNNTNPMVMNGLNNGLYNSAVGTNGCIPVQAGTLSFNIQGASMNGALIIAGNLPTNSPSPGQYGNVTMGGAGTGGFAGGGSIQYSPKVSFNGSIQMFASGGNSGQTNVSGMISLSQTVISQVLAYASTYGGNGGFNPSNPLQNSLQSICVSSIGLRVVHQTFFNGYGTGMGQIFQAQIYLTLSNGVPVPPITLQ
ncbi:hypothetical protein EB061_00035 [bacterium]|jgi:hypothetical protein|nr:hypothetical protein [bacterium]